MLIFFLNFDFAFDFSVRQLFSAFLYFRWVSLIGLFSEISKWILIFLICFCQATRRVACDMWLIDRRSVDGRWQASLPGMWWAQGRLHRWRGIHFIQENNEFIVHGHIHFITSWQAFITLWHAFITSWEDYIRPLIPPLDRSLFSSCFRSRENFHLDIQIEHHSYSDFIRIPIRKT